MRACVLHAWGCVAAESRADARTASSRRKLPVLATKDMSDGPHRVRVQAELQRPHHVVPDDRRGDPAAIGRGGAPGDEGAEVRR